MKRGYLVNHSWMLDRRQADKAGVLWRIGKDTADIAKALGVAESQVWNSMNEVKAAAACVRFRVRSA